MTARTRSPKMKKFLRQLRGMGACADGVALVREHATPEEWWAASGRGDHLLWLAVKAHVRRQDVVLAACACARLALPHVASGEGRPLHAIETAERWAHGEDGVTLTDVRAAAYAAFANAADAYAAFPNAAAAFANAAAAFAYAADAYAAFPNAADAYAAFAYAAAAFPNATADAAAYAAANALRECATLVRACIPWSAVQAALDA